MRMSKSLLQKLKTQTTVSIPEAGAAKGIRSRGGAYLAAQRGFIKTIDTGTRTKRAPTQPLLDELGIKRDD